MPQFEGPDCIGRVELRRLGEGAENARFGVEAIEAPVVGRVTSNLGDSFGRMDCGNAAARGWVQDSQYEQKAMIDVTFCYMCHLAINYGKMYSGI